MRRIAITVSPVLLIAIVVVVAHLHGQAPGTTANGSSSPQQETISPAHESNSFDITVNGPYEVVAPLFGAQGERAWAGKDWDPQFLYPKPATDVSGAVFTMSHGAHHMLWITPVFDIPNHHIQHVIIVPEYMVTIIDIHPRPSSDGRTQVHVVYEHTALTPDANEQVHKSAVRAMSQAHDWETAINESLAGKYDSKGKANQ